MIKRGIIVLALIISGAVGSAILASPAVSAQSACDDKGKILTLKPWYYGLTNADCSIVSPSDYGMEKFIGRIALTVVEDLLHLVGLVTVGFIIYGGFIYMTSSGAPDKASRGLKTVLNAAIGLCVALASIGLLNLIGGVIGI